VSSLFTFFLCTHRRLLVGMGKSNSALMVFFNRSGRFVLLKLWSPWHGGNIDIKNVSCYGYAGPRLFPVCEPR